MDALERYWFQKDYLHAFDRIAAQSEEVKASLIEHGADPVRVQVVGNLKFDAVPPADWTPARARSPRMLGALIDHGRPIIVAGCVTEYDDQHLVLDAFLKIRAQHGEALLIIAPRHPEVVERMHALDGFLQARGLPARFRSRIADEPLSCDIACLVLDTIGELGDFYAASQVAHVGTDHNVLEPLGFGKPVTVQPGWNPTYPSYPVYCLLHEHGGLIQVASVNELAAAWATLLESPESYRQAQAEIGRVLATVRGADDRHWAVVQPLLRAPSR
jgi:3-deoxy-D-manno-octulosonic-acid transferase